MISMDSNPTLSFETSDNLDGLPDGSNAFKINIDDLEFGQEIGKGAYGKIFKGEYFGTPVAIKEISLQPNDVKYKDLTKFIQREVAMLRFSHPNLVQFIGVSERGSNLYIVTEFVQGGDLAYYLFRNKFDDTPEQYIHRKVNVGSSSTPDLSDPTIHNGEKLVQLAWPLRIKIAYDVACAMAYLHSRNVIHRDLKSTNLLVGDNWRIKVCDMGFARTAQVGGGSRAKRTMTICGTTNCMAPEVVLGQDYNEACDVFSYGIVLSEIITRMDTTNNLRPSSLKYGLDVDVLLPLIPKDCPPPFLKLVLDCTEYDPDSRPTFKEITERLKSLTKKLSTPHTLPPLRILAQSPLTSPIQSPISTKNQFNPNLFKSIVHNNHSNNSSGYSNGSNHNNNINITVNSININSSNINNNNFNNNNNNNNISYNNNNNFSGRQEELMSPISMGDESDLDSDDEDDSYTSSASSSRCNSRNGKIINGGKQMGYIIKHHYSSDLESSPNGNNINNNNNSGNSNNNGICINSLSLGVSSSPIQIGLSSKSPTPSSMSPPTSVKSYHPNNNNNNNNINNTNNTINTNNNNNNNKFSSSPAKNSPKSNRFSNGSLKQQFQQYQQQQQQLFLNNNEDDKELEELSKSIDDNFRIHFSPLNISPTHNNNNNNNNNSSNHNHHLNQHSHINGHLISPTIIASSSTTSSSTSTPSLVSLTSSRDQQQHHHHHQISTISSPTNIKPLSSSIASNSSVFTPLGSGLTRTVQS
ncbi:hypothetical protein ACTFIU_003675 [Dictyostelium citrinum]